jgi:hypothetical protein
LDFHERRDVPRKTAYPVTDFLETEQAAQSESAKPDNRKLVEAE